MSELVLVKYIPLADMPRAIIVDIDGTVASHYNDVGEQMRGHYEYSKVSDDLPIPEVLEVIAALADAGNGIIFVSDREDSCREETVEWLARFGFSPDSYKLFMRKTGDHRKDFIIKYEIFRENIAEHYDILVCIDDRSQVVSMWREIGIRTLQVADGDF